MFRQNVKRIPVAVFIHIRAAPYVMRFVHADMYPPGRKTFRHGFKHFVYQFIHPFVPDQKYIVAIEQILVISIPAAQRVQMRQRLYAGNHLYSPFFRIRVDLAHFGFCISSA